MAGYQINQLPRATSVTDGDLVPVYVSSAGGAQAAPMSVILNYVEGNFVNPTFTVQTSAPASGATVTISSTTSNTWLQLAPTSSTIATLTVQMPALANCFDGQEVQVTSSGTVSALTVSGAGASVQGEPAGLAAGSSFKLRFDKNSSTWWAVGGVTQLLYILDPTGQIALETAGGSAANSVNHVKVGNNQSGNAPTITVAGPDTDIGLAIVTKGFGGLSIIADTLLAQVPNSTFTGTLTVNGASTLTGKVTASAGVVIPASTFASLPAAAGNTNLMRIVTDAIVTTPGTNVTVGGGANRVLVISDGTNWKVG